MRRSPETARELSVLKRKWLFPQLDSTSISFLFLLLLIFCGGRVWGQNSTSEIPKYEHIDSVPMGSAGIFNPEDIVISLAKDSSGSIYALTFGGAILKFDENGSPAGSVPLEGEFEGLVDLAINSQDQIFVAHYEGREILAFDMNGDSLPLLKEKTDYFKPLGITFDKDDNLYVAEYNDGSGAEGTKSSRLKIYYKDGTKVSKLENQLIQPYRIAIDGQGNIFISHAGENGKGEVAVFNKNFQELPPLTNIGAPGSISIDPFGYIHVIDYVDKLNLSKILSKDLEYLFKNIDNIKQAVKNNIFGIAIYDSDRKYIDTYRKHLDLPLDIVFGYCAGKMFVNDATIEGFATLKFNLEIYERKPNFDIEKPVANCVPPGKVFFLKNGSVIITTDEIDEGSTDNCTIKSKKLSKDTFTTTGEKTITLTVTDTSGNTAECSTNIIIEAEEEALEISCPAPQNETLDENCQFEIPDYTSLAETNNPDAIITQKPEAGKFITQNIKVELFATFEGETVSCKFDLQLSDKTPPTIICPENQTRTFDTNIGFTIPDFTEMATADDNCGGVRIKQTPAKGTIVNGDTEITLTATDDAGNKSTACSFELILTEEEVLEISCPAPQTGSLDENCQFEIPDYTSLAETNNPDAIVTQKPEAGKMISEDTKIELFATFEGETVSCKFDLRLSDKTLPTIICPKKQTRTFDPNIGFTIPDFTEMATADDNCGGVEIKQTPAKGAIVYGDIEITLTATDDAGNISTACSFELILTEEEVLEISCPAPQNEILDENCKFEIPDYTSLAETNNPDAIITQKPEAGKFITQNIKIELYATFEGKR